MSAHALMNQTVTSALAIFAINDWYYFNLGKVVGGSATSSIKDDYTPFF